MLPAGIKIKNLNILQFGNNRLTIIVENHLNKLTCRTSFDYVEVECLNFL